MADGKFLVGKPSGGVTTVTVTDGVDNTNLVLPESGTVATQAYADGKTTLTQVKAEIRTGSNLVTSPTGAIGYGNGAGGIVTQLTSKSTAVTLNKHSGRVITTSDALAAQSIAVFKLNNIIINSSDTIVLTISGGAISGGNAYNVWPSGMGSGNCLINLKNISGASLSEAIQIKFEIIKGAVS